MDTFLPQLEPLWPLLMVTLSAAAIVALTLWTYRSVQLPARPGRWVWLLVLRLAALAVACLLLLRPSWELSETINHPAILVILIDKSKSMLVGDETPGRTRWAAALEDWEQSAEIIKRLREEQNVEVVVYSFDAKLDDFVPGTEPAGERTALVKALKDTFDRHKPFDREKSSPLLGLVVVSDGQENAGKPARDAVLAELARAPCPVYVVGMGLPGGAALQPDVVAQDIQAPAIMRVKERLIVNGALQVQGFAGQEIEVWVRFDGKPAPLAENPGQPVRMVVKPDTNSQQVPLKFPAAKLPDAAGDIRVSIWAKPVRGELTDSNNEVSTYLTLTKEGLSVVYYDKDRAYEPKFLKRALKGDERITVYHRQLHTDSGSEAERWRQEQLDDLRNNVPDVIVLGEMPASRFGEELLKEIRARVEAGTGLLMIGGHESFGSGGWAGTVLEPLIPVQMDVKGQLEGGPGGQREIKFVPTEQGLTHFALRLESAVAKNREWWARLPTLNGGNKVSAKPGAPVLARSSDGEPLLAVAEIGGRTAALAVDTTWRWYRAGPPRDPQDADKPGALSESQEAHVRFWRQLILWLAKQEEAGKALRIELANRRLLTGKEQMISVQAREVTPGGSKDQQKPLRGAEFTVKVIRPDKAEHVLPVQPDGGPEAKSQGAYWKTDEPGEYEVQVTGRFQGSDLGMARARFMAYRDDSELLNRTANHTLLEQVAQETGGKFRLHSGLRESLEDLAPASATQTTKVTRLPDWHEPNLLLQGLLFLLFVTLVSVEWLLRRVSGLV
jgi:hypothetical protein